MKESCGGLYGDRSVWGIDILSDCLNEGERDKQSINISDEWFVSKKKPWMNETILESLCIKFSDFKIFDVLLFEFFQPPNECCFVGSRHIVGDSLQLSVGFYPWMLQKISINRSNLMRLTDLNGNFIEITDDSFHSVPPVNHRKMRLWISFLLHGPKKDSIVFQCFLKDMFRSKDISSDSILCYEYSPLSIRAFLSEECCVEYEDGRGILRNMRTDAKFCISLYFFFKLSSQSSMNRANWYLVIFW